MAESTLDKLLRIQSSAPEESSGNQADAGTPTAPAPPLEAARQDSSRASRGAAPYSKQFRIAFDFLQRYTGNPPQTAEDWSSIVEDMTERAQANDNDELLVDLLCAAHAQLERVYFAARSASSS